MTAFTCVGIFQDTKPICCRNHGGQRKFNTYHINPWSFGLSTLSIYIYASLCISRSISTCGAYIPTYYVCVCESMQIWVHTCMCAHVHAINIIAWINYTINSKSNICILAGTNINIFNIDNFVSIIRYCTNYKTITNPLVPLTSQLHNVPANAHGAQHGTWGNRSRRYHLKRHDCWFITDPATKLEYP